MTTSLAPSIENQASPAGSIHVPDHLEMAVRGLWIELLALLSHTVQECTQPRAIRRLQGFGVRGTKTMVRDLAREYADATRMAALCDCAPHPQDIIRRSLELTLRDDLDHDFRDLAGTYRKLMSALSPDNGSPLHRWLKSRAQVHLAQAEIAGRGA